jgi:hypothetical protein
VGSEAYEPGWIEVFELRLVQLICHVPASKFEYGSPYPVIFYVPDERPSGN